MGSGGWTNNVQFCKREKQWVKLLSVDQLPRHSRPGIICGGRQFSVSLIHYMGSLSTLAKMPKEWWAPHRKEGNDRMTGWHCSFWGSDGVYDYLCISHNALVCETDASKNLKQYIKNLDDVVAA